MFRLRLRLVVFGSAGAGGGGGFAGFAAVCLVVLLAVLILATSLGRVAGVSSGGSFGGG